MVREFQRSDLERVLEIWLRSNEEAHSFIPKEYWEGQRETVRTLLPQAELYVWQGVGEVNGFLGLDGDRIQGIFVWPAFRGRGIGQDLLDCAKESHDQLTLHVYQKNRPAIAFYERQGFSVTGEGLDEATGEREFTMHWAPGERGSGRC